MPVYPGRWETSPFFQTGEAAVSYPSSPLAPRTFGRMDGTRLVITLAMLSGLAVGYWLLLPGIQSLIVPAAPGGANGPWVIRPILAFHFGAVAVLTAVTLPALLTPLQQRWSRLDAEAGTRYDPFRDRPASRFGLLLKAGLLLVIYAASLLFYLFSWTTVGPGGIEQQLPWGRRSYTYQQVATLETIPEGMRSEALRQNGPWYHLEFRDGLHTNWSLDNEGLTPDDLTAVTAYVSARTGLPWSRRSDARDR